MRLFPGRLAKSTSVPNLYVLTDEQVAWLRETFPVTENFRIMKMMGVSYSTLYKMANRLGLQKSEEGMRAIYERNGKKHRQMNKYARTMLLSGKEIDKCTNIRLQPYTRKQVSRRQNAVRRLGYLIDYGRTSERFVIYYNSTTRRSKAFEANCIAEGFKFLPTDECLT